MVFFYYHCLFEIMVYIYFDFSKCHELGIEYYSNTYNIKDDSHYTVPGPGLVMASMNTMCSSIQKIPDSSNLEKEKAEYATLRLSKLQNDKTKFFEYFLKTNERKNILYSSVEIKKRSYKRQNGILGAHSSISTSSTVSNSICLQRGKLCYDLKFVFRGFE